jgi:hypothetical protein
VTTPDLTKLHRGWALIAEGAEEISLAYAAMAQPGARVPSQPPADDLPPLTDDDAPDMTTHSFGREVAERVGGQVIPDTALGVCPVHGKPWTTAKAGVSKKTGKPYAAFWKCSEKDGDKFCNEKPMRVWADTHPIAA